MAVLLAAKCPSLRAADVIKADNADDLNLATAWAGAVIPTVADVATWDSTVTGSNSVLLGAATVWGGMRLSNPGGPVSIGAGNTLTLLAGGIDMSAATQDLSINAGIALGTTANGSAAQTWNVALGRTLNVAAVPVRNAGTNNISNGGVINIVGSGTTRIGSAALSVITDGGGNPFVTYNTNDWAATDATGTVVAATYVPMNASIGANFIGNANIAGSFTQSGNGGTSSMRFADPATAHTVTLTGATTFTARGVLVTASSVGGTIAGGSLRPSRTSTAGATMSFIQNSLLGDLVVSSSIPNASSNTPTSITKSGLGRMILTGANGYSGTTHIHEGTLQLGNGGTVGSIPSGPIVNQASLVVNRSDSVSLANPISGSGSVTQAGAGTLNLTGANTYTGATNLNAGTVIFSAAGSLGTGAINFNGGTLRYAAGNTVDISARTVRVGTAGGTLDTNGNDLTFLQSIGGNGSGNLTKSGAGTLTLGGGSTHSGQTLVNAGTLVALGSHAGGATLGSSTTLRGNGTFSGAINALAGSTLVPGLGVGTLATGGLSLGSGSTLNFEFNATPAHDQITVTTTNGLTINGGGFNLYAEGDVSPFSAAGTYSLITYTGVIGGAGTSALSVLNPQPAKGYSFAATGSAVTLTITNLAFVSDWNVAGGGTWGTAANWTQGVPDGTGALANLKFVGGGASTVTLDAARTLGGISFDQANGYTIAPGTGGTLALNNGTSQANIVGSNGSHEISAPLTLASNSVASIAAAASLRVTGPVAGAGNLTKSGPGLLEITSLTNSMTGNVTVAGGTLAFAGAGSLGTGAITLDGGALRFLAGNTADISSRPVTIGSNGANFDTNGNDVTFANPIGNGGAGSFTKSGAGTLTLGAANAYGGGTVVTGGRLAISANDALGSPALGAGVTLNGGTLAVTGAVSLEHAGANARPVSIGSLGGGIAVAAVSTLTLPGALTGLGPLTKTGAGVLVLPNPTSFAGNLVIDAGAVQLSSATALASSLTTVNAANGLLFGNGINTVSLPGLAGSGSFELINDLVAPVTLIVGSTSTATFAGSMSGAGSLSKVGAGTQSLTGPNTYAGNTLVSGGVLQIGVGGGVNGGAANVAAAGGAQLVVNGGTLVANAASNIGNGSLGLLVSAGSATFPALSMLDNTNNSTVVRVDGGSLTASSFVMRRNASTLTGTPAAGFTNIGLYVTGGTVAISGALDLGNNNAASNVGARFDGGTTTVGGVVSIGGTHGARYGVLDVNGGTFISTDTTTGVLVGTGASNPDYFLIRAGTATVERIQLGAGANNSISEINLTGGALYVGSGGIVQGSTGANFTASLRMGNGTLGAKANWSTTLPMTLTGSTTGGTTIRAADAAEVGQDITLSGLLSGTGGLTKTGAGTLTLAVANTFTGSARLAQGTLALGNVNALANSTLDTDGTGTVTFGVTGANTYQLGGLGGSNGVNAGANSLRVGTNNLSTVLAGSVTAGGFTKAGTGLLTMTSPSHAIGGATFVESGTLLLGAASTNPLATSPTLRIAAGATLDVAGLTAGTLALSSGQTLTGAGTVTGAVAAGAGATIIPGTPTGGLAGPGTLTLGDLSLANGAVVNFGLSTANLHGALTAAASLLNVQNLTVAAGVGLNLYQPNTSLTFATNGTFDLFRALAAPPAATLQANFTVLNPAGGGTYTFGYDGTFVTLTISGLSLAGLWNVDADGVWSGAANWSGGIPTAAGDSAIFGATTSAPRTVTLDSARTLAQLSVAGGQAYTVAGSAALTLDGGANPAAVANESGSHAINVPMSLATDASVAVAGAGDTLMLGGPISNASAMRTLTKNGPGTLVLGAANSYGPAAGTVGTTLNAGALRLAAGAALGAGDLNVAGNGTLQSGVAALTVPNAITIGGGRVLTVDSLGNTLTLAGVISEAAAAGALTKIGSGTLVLTGANSFTGLTTISSGTLQIGNGGTSGSLTGPVANAGTLVFNRSDAFTNTAPISGAGALVQAGVGNTTLGTDNSFTGTTTISGGTLTLGTALALQGSTLDYNNQGGVLSFGTLNAATMANLTGAQSLALENTLSAGVQLTLGAGGQNIAYTGVLSGPGGITKQGAGNFTITTAHSYAGATLVQGGNVQIEATGGLAGGALNVAANSGARVIVNGGTLTASAVSNVGSGSAGLLVQGGTATFNAGLTTDPGTANGNLIAVTGGTLNAASLFLGRTGLNLGAEPAAGVNNSGLFINGGAVNIAGALSMGTQAATNSSVNLRMDSGSLTVGGVFTIGLNNGGRWSVADINGGTFTSTDSVTGTVLGGPAAGNALLLLRGGTANVARLQFGQGSVTGTSVLNLAGGTLYVGSGGLVKTGSVVTPVVRLGAGVLAASADWATDLEVTLNGAATIRAADAANTARQITLSGGMVGSGSLNKTGVGRLIVAGAATYAGATTVHEGTLEISGSITGTTGITVAAGARVLLSGANNDRLLDAIPITLAGGAIAIEGAASNLGETAGALSLTANSTLDFGSGDTNVLLFGSLNLGGFELAIHRWTGSIYSLSATEDDGSDATQDRLLFANSTLPGNALTNVRFYSDNGTTLIGIGHQVTYASFSEIVPVPVPEPSPAALLVAVGLYGLGWRRAARRAARPC